jgi:hypothetical protein
MNYFPSTVFYIPYALSDNGYQRTSCIRIDKKDALSDCRTASILTRYQETPVGTPPKSDHVGIYGTIYFVNGLPLLKNELGETIPHQQFHLQEINHLKHSKAESKI